GVNVAEGDAVAVAQPLQGVLVAAVVAIAMCDGRADDLAAAVAPGEGAVRRLDPQVNLAADELEAGVPHEDPGKKARLAQDLEAVADAEHRDTFVGRFGDRAHY